MSLLGIGFVLLVVGLILWLAAILPGLGYALAVVGVICIIVALVLHVMAGRRAV